MAHQNTPVIQPKTWVCECQKSMITSTTNLAIKCGACGKTQTVSE